MSRYRPDLARAARVCAIALALLPAFVAAADNCRVGSIPVPASLEMAGLSQGRTTFATVEAELRAGRHDAARDLLAKRLDDASLDAGNRAVGHSLMAIAQAGASDF